MIPILDLSALHGLGPACRDTGFFALTERARAPGSAIDPDLRTAAFAQARAFFAQQQPAKDALSIAHNSHNRGYATLGAEFLDETSGQRDRKEAFNIGLDLAADDPRVLAGAPFRGVNVWPELPGFADTMRAYFNAMHDLGRALLRPIAADLGLPEDTFEPHFDAPLATLRLLHYPPASGAADEIGAGAHTDYGALTLLATDDVPGLQIRPRGGDWTAAPHVPGGLMVNIGDALMRWTNDIYVSTPHRVLPPPRDRISLAFFLDPNPDSVIAALPGTGTPKYPPVSGADYLASRLNATYDHPSGDTA